MKKLSIVLVLLMTCAISMTGCSNKKENDHKVDQEKKRIQIGLSFDSFVIERWQRDRDVFVSTAQELGADVNVQNANGGVKEQISQIEYLIRKKMDAIVVVAVDSEALSGVLKKAKDAGIAVIAYDRLVNNANVDLCISFDNEKVGRLMAEALVKGVQKGGNIITIYGPTSDNNVALVEKGFNSVIKNSGLHVVYTVNAKDWLAEKAFTAVNTALSKTPNIDGVMCGNDNLASEAVKALSENRLAGKVVLTGQDADLVACQRIVEGTQTMTVYKPVDQLAKSAAEYAVRLAKGEEIDVKESIDDGNYNVPYVKLEPIAVNKDNIYQVIIEGGFQREQEVYLNVPK